MWLSLQLLCTGGGGAARLNCKAMRWQNEMKQYVTISRTCKYIRSARGADKDAKRLLKEVHTLLSILRGLDSLGAQIDNAQLSTHISAEQIQHCAQTLERIKSKLHVSDPAVAGSKYQKFKRTLEWPFTSSETNEILDDLGRYKVTFDLTISMDVLELLLLKSSVHDETSARVKQIASSTLALERIQLSKERRKVLQFFTAPSLASTHLRNMKMRHPGTGEWFIRSPEFEEWLNGQNHRLWLYGIPGSGKSAMVASAIDETIKRATPSCGVRTVCSSAQRTIRRSYIGCWSGSIWSDVACSIFQGQPVGLDREEPQSIQQAFVLEGLQ
ncbi:uncharacterized protein LTR77_002546 [Saxophila tyrrhenica]|uniref:Nephrocystin 3-like N-terminal domain-containing protein n=1 Tax=Saxophila tyrrhenica TaxID=1690608 RepID=A0AAV9PMC7_9PEZI|nr:hypothetical protein LTR77_002546 [Saxophila tyrrhenica]